MLLASEAGLTVKPLSAAVEQAVMPDAGAPPVAPTSPVSGDPLRMAQANTPPPPSPSPSQPADTAPTTRSWVIPPIYWWGDVSYDIRRETIEDQPTTLRQVTTLNLNAATYLYEPWFAIITGGVGFSLSRLSDTELSGSDRFVTGSLKLNLLPLSRFPTEIRYSRSDSRTESGLGAASDYTTTRYGISQRYRTADSLLTASGTFDHYVQEGSIYPRDVQDTAGVEAVFQPRRGHSLGFGASLNEGKRPATGEESTYRTLVGRYTYNPDPTFSSETTANFTYNEQRFPLNQSEIETSQLSSFAFWRPSTMPLTVSGSARLLEQKSGETDTRVATFAVGANYAWNRNLRLNGSVSVNMTNTGTESRTVSTESIGATYSGDSIEWGNLRYDWFGGVTALHTTGVEETEETPNARSVGFDAQIGHGITGTWRLNSANSVSYNVGQTFAWATDPREGNIRQVVHSAGVGWTRQELNHSMSLRLNGTDSRLVNGSRDTFQLINLQFTSDMEFSRDASLSGNLTGQWTRNQRRAASDLDVVEFGDNRFRSSASADLTFRKFRLFQVPRLTFQSQLRINRNEVVERFGELEQRESRSWENRLDYQIGRLELRLLSRFGEIEKRKRSLLMFKAVRRF